MLLTKVMIVSSYFLAVHGQDEFLYGVEWKTSGMADSEMTNPESYINITFYNSQDEYCEMPFLQVRTRRISHLV